MAHKVDNRSWFSKCCCFCCGDVEDNEVRSPLNQDQHTSETYHGVTFASPDEQQAQLRRQEYEREQRLLEQQRRKELEEHGDSYVPPSDERGKDLDAPHTPPPSSGTLTSVTPEGPTNSSVQATTPRGSGGKKAHKKKITNFWG